MTKPKGPVGESDRTLRARQTPAKPGTLQSPVAAPEAPPTATRNPAAETFAEPVVQAQQPAAVSSATAAAYEPKKVPIPRSAKNKGVPGRVPMVNPEWTRRKNMRYPPRCYPLFGGGYGGVRGRGVRNRGVNIVGRLYGCIVCVFWAVYSLITPSIHRCAQHLPN